MKKTRTSKLLLSAAVATVSSLTMVAASLPGAAGASGQAKGKKSTSAPLLVSYFSNGFYSGVVATQPGLRKMIPTTTKFIEVQSGPATLAGMKTGSFDMTTQTGNPPITGAIALHTPVQVVWAEAYDNAGLVVSKSIHNVAQMAGKTFGYLEGSSEAFSFQSWLKLKGLANKVKLVNLDRAAMVAAMKTGAIAGGYNDFPFATQMVKEGGRLVVTSKQIAGMGFPSLNMLTVDTNFAAQHPAVVQGYVCADAKAYGFMKGKAKRRVLAHAARFLGLPARAGLVAGLEYPLFAPHSELTPSALGTPGHVASGAVAKALFLTGSYLKAQGLLTTPPSMAEIVKHVNLKFAEGVAHGACR